MSNRFTAMVVSSQTITTTTETVVATAPAASFYTPGSNGVSISGVVNFTMGASGTAVTVRVRQGSLTGPLVGNAVVETLAAAAIANIPYEAEDTSGFPQAAGSIYVVTVQATAATGNDTVNQATIEVASA